MGGTVDPESGKVIWDFHVPLDEQRPYYAANPPSALGKLRATATELPGHRFDGHGEPVSVVYALACPCGTDTFTLLVHVDDNNDATPPIFVECSACDETYEIYDFRKHGFDGVHGNNRRIPLPDHDPLEMETDELACPHHVLVCFEFPSDHLGDGETIPAQDRFSWITVVGRDEEGVVETLFDDEAA